MQVDLKHTWRVSERAWYIKLYCWVYDAKREDITFCKIWWAYCFMWFFLPLRVGGALISPPLRWILGPVEIAVQRALKSLAEEQKRLNAIPPEVKPTWCVHCRRGKPHRQHYFAKCDCQDHGSNVSRASWPEVKDHLHACRLRSTTRPLQLKCDNEYLVPVVPPSRAMRIITTIGDTVTQIGMWLKNPVPAKLIRVITFVTVMSIGLAGSAGFVVLIVRNWATVTEVFAWVLAAVGILAVVIGTGYYATAKLTTKATGVFAKPLPVPRVQAPLRRLPKRLVSLSGALCFIASLLALGDMGYIAATHTHDTVQIIKYTAGGISSLGVTVLGVYLAVMTGFSVFLWRWAMKPIKFTGIASKGTVTGFWQLLKLSYVSVKSNTCPKIEVEP